MQIRTPTFEDLDTIVKIGKVMHEESMYRDFDYDEEKVANTVYFLMSAPEGIAFVIEDEGKIIGGALGIVTEHYFGRNKIAQDYAIFVLPEHRRSRAGILAVQEYVRQAQKRGADEIMLGTTTGVETAKVAKLYERFGFAEIGRLYKLRIE